MKLRRTSGGQEGEKWGIESDFGGQKRRGFTMNHKKFLSWAFLNELGGAREALKQSLTWIQDGFKRWWSHTPGHPSNGMTADCIRFANPAEADWRREIGEPGGGCLGSTQLRNSGSPEPRNSLG